MTTTSRTAITRLRSWSGRLAAGAAAVLAVATLAALLLGFSLVANIAHVAGELAAASEAVKRQSPGSANRWEWPLAGRPSVLRGFEPPPRPWLPGHRGVDLTAGAEAATAVLAAGQGIVWYAGVLAGRGVVSIEHPNGLRTTYEPVTPTVHAGQPVKLGDQLGTLAAGHEPCQFSCLHWGLRSEKEYFDPLALLGRARVRLLPLGIGSQD